MSFRVSISLLATHVQNCFGEKTDPCCDDTKFQENDVPSGYIFGLYDDATLTFNGDFEADSISATLAHCSKTREKPGSTSSECCLPLTMCYLPPLREIDVNGSLGLDRFRC